MAAQKPAVLYCLACCACVLSTAADWPQWRGPDRNGISPERNWLAGWPDDGVPRVAWETDVGKGHSCVVVADGSVFITTAQEHRSSARFSIRGTTLQEDWQNKRVACYTGGCVLWQDHLYLVDSRGVLRCLAWQTGEERWSQRGFDERGTLTAADGHLLIQTGSSGELVVVAAESGEYQELRRTRVFGDGAATFTAPVLANGRIYCRSYEGRVVCLELGQEPAR